MRFLQAVHNISLPPTWVPDNTLLTLQHKGFLIDLKGNKLCRTQNYTIMFPIYRAFYPHASLTKQVEKAPHTYVRDKTEWTF